MRDRLSIGQEVKVEGPYGCFTFDDGRARQIWIGGGVGVTPFIARMKHLAREQADPSQRAAMEKTLLMPAVAGESWIGQAVALVVIYRWYAPQLVSTYALAYDDGLEAATLTRLHAELPDWPTAITTD